MKRLLFTILILLFSVNCYAEFPTTGILDDFNRSNENPLSDGGNWNGPIWSGDGQLEVVSNQAMSDNSGWGGSWWDVETFTDSEVYVTLPVAFDRMELNIRFDGMGTAAIRGYYITFDEIDSEIDIARLDDDDNDVELGATISQSLSSGDKVGVSMIGDTLTVWLNEGSGWNSLGTRTDSTYASGYIAIATDQDTARFDDFGGGEVIVSARRVINVNISY